MSIVCLDQRAADRQPNAAPAERPRTGLVHTVEALEQVRQVLGRDAAPSVGNMKRHCAVPPLGAHAHSASFGYLLKIPGERRTLVATHPIR